MTLIEALTTSARLAEHDPAAAIDSLPWLAAALASDRANERFSAWGASTVIDENTGEAVISQSLFDELHHRAGIAATWPRGNAGVLHCYGYLLSLAETPYGLKRDRWTTPDLARAYGLADDAFAPDDASGTLLARVGAAMRDVFASATITVETEAPPSRIACFGTGFMSAVAYAVDGLLITTFPVGTSPQDTAAALEAEPPRLRWNAS